MNDDQVRSELERRSATSSRPDWARRDLLPAVWREVDAWPQRVMTSNWSPRLGVAAVVAALLILVIAVPRLAPQLPSSSASPSASPSAGPDTVFSTAEFATGVATGELLSRVVLVRAKISVPAAPDPQNVPCVPPDGLCALGAVEGADPPLYVYAAYTATTDTPGLGTWAGADGGRDYHFPSVPIEGVLALRVLSESQVEFVGLARQSDEGSAWSVAGVDALEINAARHDEVLLVDGWLGGATMTFCLAHPVPTIDLLPNRPCSDELVSRDPYPESGSPVLQVQPGAYAAFAPDPIIQDGNVPRKALYALAPRLEGWCRDSNPPCWQWNVIARLNGPPDVPPAVAPATIECTRSTGLPLTITDETGVVADCRSLDGASQFDPALVLNPDGNLSLLRVLFSASRCISGAEARFGGGPGAYSFVLTEGDVVQGCEGPPIGIGIDLGLRTDIAAAMVTATKASPPATALGRVTVTCDAPVVPGHCLQPLAWAVAHLPSGLAPVTSVSIMEINLCPSASPCVGQPHYYEWWAAFTLRDRAQLGMWVSNAFGTNTLKSADLGATPPPGAEPVSGSFTLNCGVGDDATCTGAAAASTDNSPNRPPDVVDVEQASGSPEHYLVNITFVDGTSTSVEVAPDPSADNGWSTVVLPSAVAEELEGWNVTCVDVGFVDCHGVAALFVNNLARSYGSVLAESGGQVTVVPRPQCPRVPSFIDATSCWQAIAPAADKDVCMVVGRDLPAVPPESRIFGFAQVGGDDMSGRAVPPQDWPPCV